MQHPLRTILAWFTSVLVKFVVRVNFHAGAGPQRMGLRATSLHMHTPSEGAATKTTTKTSCLEDRYIAAQAAGRIRPSLI